jgi:membrane associated rhomboid family serine protease
MYENKPSFWGSIPIIVKNLLIINVLLFLATITLPRIGSVYLDDYLGLHYFEASKFNPIQLITYMFMHGNISHLFFNMFSLFMFGRFLEQVWGPQKFLFYYMITGIGAGLIQEITWYIELRPLLQEISNIAASGHIHEGVLIGEKVIYSASDLFALKAEYLNRFITVGASGAVFGLLLAFGMLFPNMPLFIMFIPIPIKAKYFVIVYGLLELMGGIISVSGSDDGIAHFAHLGGMLFGYILIKIWNKKRFQH